MRIVDFVQFKGFAASGQRTVWGGITDSHAYSGISNDR